MTVAKLGFEVSTGSLPAAIADLDKLVAAASRVETATGKAAAAATANLGKTAAQAESFAARIDKALNVRAGSMVGTPFAQDAMRAEDIRAYGRELDVLRAKYNPLYAAVSQYKNAVLEIKKANAVGAISHGEMTAAIERERTATLRLMEASRQQQKTALLAGGAGKSKGGSGGSQRQLSANLMYQFQDVAVTTAMGMSPAMIALQQGTQIGAALTSIGGAKEGVKGLTSALTSMFSLTNLLPIAIIGFGAAAIQWFTSAGDKAKDYNEILKQNAANVARLGPAYESAAKARQLYEGTAESTNVVNRLLGIDADDAAKMLQADVYKSLEKLRSTSVGRGTTLQGVLGLITSTMDFSGSDFMREIGRGLTDITAQVEPFRALILQFEKDGPAGVMKFREGVVSLGEAFPQFKEQAGVILTVTNDIAAAVQKNAELRSEVDMVAVSLGHMSDIMKDASLTGFGDEDGKISQYMTTLIDKFSKGQMTGQTFKDTLASLAAVQPNFAGVIGQISALTGEMEKAVAAGRGLSQTLGNSKYASMDDAQSDYKEQYKMWRRFGDDGPGGFDPDRPKTAKTGSKADPYRDLIKGAKDRIEQLKVEQKLLSQVGEAAAAYRYEQELLAQGTDKGRSLTEAQRKEIKKLADEYGRLTTALAESKMAQDLLFERDQMFRSSADQKIASALRGAGMPIDFDGYIAGLMRTNDQLKLGKDLATDFFGGISQDLRNGVDIVDALSNAFGRLGDRLLQMATDMAIQSLFSSLMGGVGGGFGTSNGFASMLGMAKGGAFGPTGITPFAKGGIFDSPTLFKFAKGTGMMGEAGPEAIMPLTRDGQGRLGVRAGGGSAGGGSGRLHITVETTVSKDGSFVSAVKNISEETTGAGISSFARSHQFSSSVDHSIKRLQGQRKLK